MTSCHLHIVWEGGAIHLRFWLGGAGGENKLNTSLERSRFTPFGLLKALLAILKAAQRDVL